MDSMTIIAVASIVTAGLTTGIGCMGPALGEGRSVATALTALAQQPAPLPGSLAGNRMLDAWIRINPDGTAMVCTGKVELGQGIITALAPSAIFLASFTENPRRSSQLDSAPPASEPSPEAAGGIQTTDPVDLKSKCRAS